MLDRLKSNWEEWDRRLNLVVDQRHFSYYLDGSFTCPDPNVHPKAALNWKSNDRALRAFILEHVSNVEYGITSQHTLAHDVYDALRKTHENLGIHAQVHLMKEVLDLRFSLAPPLNLRCTLDNIDRMHDRLTKMEKLDDDKFKILFIINALDSLPALQSIISELLQSSPSITSTDVKNRVIREEQLLARRERLGLPLAPGLVDNTAFAAVVNKPRPICANCKRANHRMEFCIAPGGQMAGKSIEEARTAQRAASGKPQSRNNRNATTQSANVSQSIPPISAEPSKSNNTVMFNGKSYMLVSDTNVATAQANDNTALTAVSTADYDHISLADYDQEEYNEI